jgi:hypothetical protein
MEYNFPFLEGQMQRVRKFNHDEPFSPCDSIPSEFSRSCYFELGDYLPGAYSKDYAILGGLCSTIGDISARKYCFYGLGYHSDARERDDKDAVKALCSQMPAREEEIWCLAGAHSCEVLKGEEFTRCDKMWEEEII